MGQSSNIGDQAAAQTRQQQDWTNTAVNGINQAFAGFNPAYYQGVQQAYTANQLPQLQQQFQQNEQNLGYKLAGQGLGQSSVAEQGQAALMGNLGSAETQIGQGAVQAADQMQTQVENQKANLIGQAQTATDPAAAYQQALSTAAGISAPSTFAPLGNMFNQFASTYLTNQNNNLYNNFANQYLNSISNPGIYGGSGATQPALPQNIY